jgi:phosphatidylserine synthase
MIKNKKILLALLLVAGVFIGVVKVIRASNEASVAATVTVQNISVELDGTDGAVAYGTLAVGTSKTTLEMVLLIPSL